MSGLTSALQTLRINPCYDPATSHLRRIQGKIAEDGKDGGHFEISGTLNTEKNSGQITARLTDFNQNGLRPFLESMFVVAQATDGFRRIHRRNYPNQALAHAFQRPEFSR